MHVTSSANVSSYRPGNTQSRDTDDENEYVSQVVQCHTVFFFSFFSFSPSRSNHTFHTQGGTKVFLLLLFFLLLQLNESLAIERQGKGEEIMVRSSSWKEFYFASGEKIYQLDTGWPGRVSSSLFSRPASCEFRNSLSGCVNLGQRRLSLSLFHSRGTLEAGADPRTRIINVLNEIRENLNPDGKRVSTPHRKDTGGEEIAVSDEQRRPAVIRWTPELETGGSRPAILIPRAWRLVVDPILSY